MPYITYKEKRFSRESQEIIDLANQIIEEYQKQGFSLTLRQLYYQFVARGYLPNTAKNYNRLGSIVNNARLAGLIDWYAIEDRTRWLRTNVHWDSPSEIIQACANQYAVDMWDNQDYRPEVWIEKDALVGVIEGVCIRYDVPYFACRGYVSQSEQWRAGRRHLMYFESNQQPVLFHFGDHDPSGLDMTRDNNDRLFTFTDNVGVDVRRLALNMDQVQQYNPPHNPAKITDTRAGEYIANFGSESWELDALEPKVIENLIETNITSLIDWNRWDEQEAKQQEGRDILNKPAQEQQE